MRFWPLHVWFDQQVHSSLVFVQIQHFCWNGGEVNILPTKPKWFLTAVSLILTSHWAINKSAALRFQDQQLVRCSQHQRWRNKIGGEQQWATQSMFPSSQQWASNKFAASWTRSWSWLRMNGALWLMWVGAGWYRQQEHEGKPLTACVAHGPTWREGHQQEGRRFRFSMSTRASTAFRATISFINGFNRCKAMLVDRFLMS